MKSLAPEIVVSDLPGGAVQYRLPVRPGAINRAGGLICMIIGGIISVAWAAAIVFLLIWLPGFPLPSSDDLTFTIHFYSLTILFFGSGLTIGPVMFFLGLFLAFGHTEISIHREQLHVTNRCGSLRWTRHQLLSRIRGFGIDDGNSAKNAETSPEVDRTTNDVLMADLLERRPMMVCWGYPAAWLPALAEELAEACSRSGAAGQLPRQAQDILTNSPENPYSQPTVF